MCHACIARAIETVGDPVPELPGLIGAIIQRATLSLELSLATQGLELTTPEKVAQEAIRETINALGEIMVEQGITMAPQWVSILGVKMALDNGVHPVVFKGTEEERAANIERVQAMIRGLEEEAHAEPPEVRPGEA